MDELFRRLRRFLRSLPEKLQQLQEDLKKGIPIRLPASVLDFYQEVKEAILWLYIEIKKDLTTIYMRSLLKLTGYAIETIFYLAVLLEGLMDGGNYKSPGVAMDNLLSGVALENLLALVFRGLVFVWYLVWSFAKLHTWLPDMTLSQLVPFVFNTHYPLLLKILWFLLLLLSKGILFLLNFFF